MELKNPTFPEHKTRLGFHYFPDTLHYCEDDLQIWLPELTAMGASWLVLQSSCERAIPEHFITSLIQAGIEPLLQFNLCLEKPPEIEPLQTLLESYARWGVHGVSFFDRPNDRSAWQSSDWVQQDLVERFLDRFVPLASLALDIGLTPIFPPLEPGGSYWDTAFLRSALESLLHRKQIPLLQNLVLSAYAWTGGHSLNWGCGGPQRWPGAKPYFTPAKEQDQCGFRVYDWYNAISLAVLQKICPTILLGAGQVSDPLKNPSTTTPLDQQVLINMNIARLLAGETVTDPTVSGDAGQNPGEPQPVLESLPNEVISCNYWLLSADTTSPFISHAWYPSPDSPRPVVKELKDWWLKTSRVEPDATGKSLHEASAPHRMNIPAPKYKSNGQHPIQHYLLLPKYDWGIADWHLDIIRPFVKKYTPTVGFSAEEASLANHVTVVGSQQTFPDDLLNALRQAGCSVDRIDGDGTSIASKLAER